MTEFQNRVSNYKMLTELRRGNAIASLPREIRNEMRTQLDEIGITSVFAQDMMMAHIIEGTEKADELRQMLEKEVV